MYKKLAALCGLTILGGLLAGAPLPRASAKVGAIDKELLGIRLLQSYKSVLQLYGQPTRIYRIDEAPVLIPALDASGKETGGIKGLGDSSQSGGSPGGGGPMGMGGSPMGMPGSGGPMMPGSGGPMMPGGKGKGGGMGMPGSGGPTGGAGGSSDKPETFAEAGGFIWVYYYAHDELAYIFFFNHDGRIEMISEHGRYKGKPSSRGVHLGDQAKSVYNTYGWPDTVEPQSTTIALNYNLKHHVLFNVLNGKVSAISVILKETEYPHLIGVDSNGGGGAPGMGRPGGPPMGGGTGGRKSGGGGPGGAPGA